MRLVFLLLMALFCSFMKDHLEEWSAVGSLTPYVWERDEFRKLQLGESLAAKEAIDSDALASLMAAYGFDLTDFRDSADPVLQFPVKKPEEFRKLSQYYGMIFDDLKYFPVPLSCSRSVPDITYSDGWMQKRSYGGERGHEGCDLMGNKMPRGFYPVVSMTDGTVEKTGWLEQGGWRIGIRAPSGAYFYYAHLYRYERQWKEGDVVRAGELLGYMGDSGYGEEGTTGMFDVHLHVGIYLKTEHYEELSVNPYWVLRYLEKKRLIYDYGDR